MSSQPPPRVVIDTNIFIPGVVGASATPPKLTASAGLLRAWRAGFCSVIVSEALHDEYMEVLQRPAFGVGKRRAMRLRARISDRAINVKLPVNRPLLTVDPDDDMVLKTAIAGKAELLVTDNASDFAEIAALRGGTADLRYRGVRVVGLSPCLDTIRALHPNADRIMRRSRRWP
jgi:putative PIN family toxin of toxin-antitoxin system